ncbi:hypothetical protein HanOQP8_Chr05g0178501 [Helianthus annuus]|nr:hypothetical protein HanOQP8_Chr05g0178501 [Helianthus annuus]KAJ0749578.1 hypothetical protein HanLR1_Chr05g0171531 [Helianthus annuus]
MDLYFRSLLYLSFLGLWMDLLSHRLEDLRKFVVCISVFLFLFKDASFESDITTEKVRGLKQAFGFANYVPQIEAYEVKFFITNQIINLCWLYSCTNPS